MTRTGRSPRLAEHAPEPFVDLHAQDALLCGVRPGELGLVVTKWGTMIARVRTSGEIARGAAFVPIHWNAMHSSHGRAGAIVNPVTDPLSGEPEFKHTPARVVPYVVDWYGCVLTRVPFDNPDVAWWSVVRGEGFSRYELAGRRLPADWTAWGREFLRVHATSPDYLEYLDESAGIYRAVHVLDERLEACLYVSPRIELPARGWLSALFAKPRLTDSDRTALLAGRPLGASVETGSLVCSCFRVGSGAIRRAIAEHGLTSMGQVSARLRAGSNCGSCLPEIRALIAQTVKS
jgi:assimilatory nitrate reductase catalytic subunit